MIFVDLDSTLNNLIIAWVEFLSIKEGKPYTLQDIDKWDSIYHLFDNPDIFLKEYYFDLVKPQDKAEEFMEELSKIDDVVIITDTNEKDAKEKRRWLNRYFTEYKVIFSNNDKYSYMKENDILIDDKFYAVYDAVNKAKAWGLLYRCNNQYCYNDYIWHNPKFRIVFNYDEALEQVKKIYGRI